MTKKVCGNCEHFSHEPNTPSRGVCWYSAEFDYYVVRGEKWAGCRDWEPKRETNWQRYFGSPEKVADYFLANISTDCDHCFIEGKCYSEGCGGSCKHGMIEWLEGDAE